MEENEKAKEVGFIKQILKCRSRWFPSMHWMFP